MNSRPLEDTLKASSRFGSSGFSLSSISSSLSKKSSTARHKISTSMPQALKTEEHPDLQSGLLEDAQELHIRVVCHSLFQAHDEGFVQDFETT